jgi:hypothetical protein
MDKSSSNTDLRKLGGVNMPTTYMRMSATWPLAVLVVNDSRVSLRLRGPLRRIGGVPLDAVPGDLARVFPTHRLWARGVGFIDHEGREWYFWTRQVQRVLATLHEHGFAVTTAPQRATKFWRGVP